jgi:hypothetical protein
MAGLLCVYVLYTAVASWRDFISLNNESRVQPPPASNLLVFVPFLGSHIRATAETIFYERLAFQAWQRVAHKAQAANDSVRLLALVESVSQCDVFTNLASSNEASINFFSCHALPSHCLHPHYDNLPMINCLFDVAKTYAQPSELLLYSNGDITFSTDLLGALSSAMQEATSLVHTKSKELVMVGRRTDVPIPLNFRCHGTLDGLLQMARRAGTLHQDSGVDYFVFTQSAFPSSFLSTTFPPFLVGRYRWDNALLASFLHDPDVVTIDMTASVQVMHPSVQQASDTDHHHLQRLGASYNEQLAHQYYGYGYTLGRIDNTELVMEADLACPGRYSTVLRKNRPDDDLLLALGRAKVIPRRKRHGEEHSLSFLLLITVAPEEISIAVAWSRYHASSIGEAPGFLFLTRDEDTYLGLSLHVPNAVLADEKVFFRGLEELPQFLRWDTFDRLLHYQLMIGIVGASHATIGCDGAQENDQSWFEQLLSRVAAGNCEIIVSDNKSGREEETFLAIRPTAKAMAFWDLYKNHHSVNNALLDSHFPSQSLCCL